MSKDSDDDASSQTSATLSEARSVRDELLHVVDEIEKPPSRWNLSRTRSSSSESETDTATESSGESELRRQEEWNGLFQRILNYRHGSDDDDSDSDTSGEEFNHPPRTSIGDSDRPRTSIDKGSASTPGSSPLFVLNSESKQIVQLTQQLRQFLSHYSPRAPLDPENATALAEGFAETLRQVLTPSQYENATNVINSCCGQWIHSLFRLPAATRPVFVDSAWDGRLAVAKAALQRQWPDFVKKGFCVFGNTIPTIYSSFNEPYLEQLQTHLGLPEQSIRAGEDIVAMIESDLLANVAASETGTALRQPFLVLAHAGDAVDRFDNLSRLHALCKNEKLWLHVEGESVVLLAQKKPPAELEPISSADSLLINAADVCPGENVNSYVAFYRRDAPAWAMVEKLGVSTKRMQLALWLQMQMLGRSNIVNGITKAHHLVQLMTNRLEKAPFIQFLSQNHPAQVQVALRFAPGSSASAAAHQNAPAAVRTSSELTEAPKTPHRLKSASVAIPPPSTVVSSSDSVQQPSTETNEEGQEENPSSIQHVYAADTKAEKLPVPQLAVEEVTNITDDQVAQEQTLPHLNQINQRILKDVMHSLQSEDNHSIVLEVVLLNLPSGDADARGSRSPPFNSYFRFAPLTSRSLWQLSDAQVNAFCDRLLQKASLINSAILCRPAFSRACESYAPGALITVESRPSTLLGLGAVRYRPSLLAALSTASPAVEGEKIAELVDELNERILKRLGTHKLFGSHLVSQSRTQEGGHTCIAIGLDSKPFTERRVAKLVRAFLSVAHRVEAKINFQDRVGQIVAASVKAAQLKLKQESERVKQEEGLIRKIPIVGSVWNWWAPVEKNIKGQSFDLLSSSIEVHEKPHAQATPVKQPATVSAPTSVRKVFVASSSQRHDDSGSDADDEDEEEEEEEIEEQDETDVDEDEAVESTEDQNHSGSRSSSSTSSNAESDDESNEEKPEKDTST